jgi:hypothetical protein
VFRTPDFARRDYNGPPIKDLLDVLDYVKPTALMGLSTQSGAFPRAVIETMAALNPLPIIFPLSNPVKLSECTFDDAVKYTNGASRLLSHSTKRVLTGVNAQARCCSRRARRSMRSAITGRCYTLGRGITCASFSPLACLRIVYM